MVAAIQVELFDKRWALPVLTRLHRSEKRCRAEGRPYKKTTDHAREMVARLGAELPDRPLIVIGDAAYTNSSLIKDRPANVILVGRGRLDARAVVRVTVTDMLETLRRASWRERLFDPGANAAVLRKTLQPLVEYVSCAA